MATHTEFMIIYFTRFKTSILAKMAQLQRNPIGIQAVHNMQMNRARQVIMGVNTVLEMGEHALELDQQKFEAARELVFSSYHQFCATAREISHGRLNVRKPPSAPMQYMRTR